MPYKQLLLRAEAREKIVRGAAGSCRPGASHAWSEIEMCTDWQKMETPACLR